MNMTTSVERRRFLKSIAAAGLILPGMSIYQHALADVEGLDLGSAQPFDFADLIERVLAIELTENTARRLAAGTCNGVQRGCEGHPCEPS